MSNSYTLTIGEEWPIYGNISPFENKYFYNLSIRYECFLKGKDAKKICSNIKIKESFYMTSNSVLKLNKNIYLKLGFTFRNLIFARAFKSDPSIGLNPSWPKS